MRHVQTAQAEAFIDEFQSLAKLFPEPSTRFVHQTDPKDSVFFNLAIETRADYLVTYDEAHVLAVREVAHAQHELLERLVPDLKIVKPFELARALALSEKSAR